MKRKFARVVALLAPAIMFYAGPASGQSPYAGSPQPASSYYSGTSEGRYVSVADTKQMLNNEAAAGGGCNSCGACDVCADSCCDNLCVACDDCPDRGLVWFTNLESYRGITEGTYQNNNGIRTGLNWGRTITDGGLGVQLGASYAAYDWNGRTSITEELAPVQEQMYITTGFFRRANGDSRWNAAIVYDWLITDNYSVFANEPFLGQWRGLLGYALNDCNEIGVWAAIDDRGDSQDSFIFGNTRYRPLAQYNTYWHRNYECGADTWFYVGIPDDERLTGGGSLGDFIFGLNASAPLSDRWALTGDIQYMNPTSQAGVVGSREEFWFVSVGLSYYPGRNARQRSVAGDCNMPLMPVANPGTFMVDSDRVQ